MATLDTPVARVRIVKEGTETFADFFTREDAEGVLNVIARDWTDVDFMDVERDGFSVGTIGGPNQWFAEVIDL